MKSMSEKEKRALDVYYSSIRFNRARYRMLSFLHPLLQKLSRCIREYPYEIHGEDSIRNTTAPVIYAVSHSEYGPEDIQLVKELMPRPAYTLANWRIRSMHFYVRAFFACAGTIYVKRDHRYSRGKAKEKCIAALRAGYSVAIYPEGTWNLTPAELVLPFRHGIIKIALAAHVPILPISLSMLGGKYYIEAGEPLVLRAGDPTAENSRFISDAATTLRDSLATLKWIALERYAEAATAEGYFQRTSVSEEDFKESIVARIINGHKKHGMRIDIAEETAVVYRTQQVNGA